MRIGASQLGKLEHLRARSTTQTAHQKNERKREMVSVKEEDFLTQKQKQNGKEEERQRSPCA